MTLVISELYVVIPRKREARPAWPQGLPWTPAFAGVTGNVLI
jgi:hypothetical protein